jgi:hypothetical protein
MEKKIKLFNLKIMFQIGENLFRKASNKNTRSEILEHDVVNDKSRDFWNENNKRAYFSF